MIRHEKRMLANKFVPKWLSGLSLREIETTYIIHVFLYFVPSFIGFLLSSVSHLSFCICWAPKFLVFWCLLLLHLFEHDIDEMKTIFHLKLKHFNICKITIFSMPLSIEKNIFAVAILYYKDVAINPWWSHICFSTLPTFSSNTHLLCEMSVPATSAIFS